MERLGTSDQRRRSVIQVSVVLGLIVVALVLWRTVWADRDPARPNGHAAQLVLPAHVDGFTQLTDSTYQTLVAQLRAAVTGAGSIWPADSDVMLYGGGPQHASVFMVLAASGHDDASLATTLRTQKSSVLVDELMIDSQGIAATSVPAAPLDGTLDCATGVFSAQQRSECIWAGASTLGQTIALTPDLTSARLASLTGDLRRASEH